MLFSHGICVLIAIYKYLRSVFLVDLARSTHTHTKNTGQDDSFSLSENDAHSALVSY